MREFLTPLGSLWEPVRNAFLTHIADIGKGQERIPDTLRREEWVWISFLTVRKREERGWISFLTARKREERVWISFPTVSKRQEWVRVSFPTVSKRQEWIRVSFLTVPKRQERIPDSSWGGVRNAFLTHPKQHRLRKSIDLACLLCELVLLKKRQPQARIV